MARPIPLELPVTSARFPCSRIVPPLAVTPLALMISTTTWRGPSRPARSGLGAARGQEFDHVAQLLWCDVTAERGHVDAAVDDADGQIVAAQPVAHGGQVR